MPGDRQALRQKLYRLAASQAGYFTAAQALDVGYSYQAQRHHVEYGNWVRIDRGLFRIPEWPSTVNDTLVRWVLWSKQRAVVSHDTAAAAYGLGVVNAAKIHLTVPPDFRMEDSSVVLHHGVLLSSDVATLDGAAITTIIRTVIDLIETHVDEELIEGVVSDALSSGAISRGQIQRRSRELSPDAQARTTRVLQKVAS
jgi:predicted transcriptional regulator of viral defense system